MDVGLSKKIEKAYSIQTQDWKPQSRQEWPAKKKLKVGHRNKDIDDFAKDINAYVKKRKWVFPTEVVHFISDIHADADAFFKSLVGAGMIEKTGKADSDFTLTKKALQGKLIIGGDCLDKGPSNLRLLDAIKLVKDAGMKTVILAGNHDFRTYVGLKIGEERKLVAEHMFVRMGKKTIPLFREIYRKYLHKHIDVKNLPSAEEVEDRLFPSKAWFDSYGEKMSGLIPPMKIEKEIIRIQEKIIDVRNYLDRTGFTHGMLYATLEKARELFFNPKGEYAWFFNEMKLAHQEGSFLFVHAGVDDFSTDWLGQAGVDGLNEKFDILKRNDPFELYHGHLGNMFRTKYRDVDFPFTKGSVKKINNLGIQAIVHGHRNTVQGHRITIKRGLLNFECDTSLDRKTRIEEGLPGYGASWFTIHPKGVVEAYSTDYPAIKKFDLKKVGGKMAKKLPSNVKVEDVPSLKLTKKSKISAVSNENRLQAKEIFKRLSDDFLEGVVKIEDEKEAFVSAIPENVELKFNGQQDGDFGQLNIQITWGEKPIKKTKNDKSSKKSKKKK